MNPILQHLRIPLPNTASLPPNIGNTTPDADAKSLAFQNLLKQGVDTPKVVAQYTEENTISNNHNLSLMAKIYADKQQKIPIPTSQDPQHLKGANPIPSTPGVSRVPGQMIVNANGDTPLKTYEAFLDKRKTEPPVKMSDFPSAMATARKGRRFSTAKSQNPFNAPLSIISQKPRKKIFWKIKPKLKLLILFMVLLGTLVFFFLR